jgi:hypothetical protein
MFSNTDADARGSPEKFQKIKMAGPPTEKPARVETDTLRRYFKVPFYYAGVPRGGSLPRGVLGIVARSRRDGIVARPLPLPEQRGAGLIANEEIAGITHRLVVCDCLRSDRAELEREIAVAA